jgi:predicted alpha/beta-fold hydrolase
LSRWSAERIHFEAGDGDTLNGVLHRPQAATGRIVVLVHGLTGCEDSAYVRATARHLLLAGRPVLRLNLRGAPPSRATCRRMYHAGRSDDLALVFDRLADRGDAPGGIDAVGYSLGGNVLLKHLSETGGASPVSRAVAVSAPLDLATVSRRLEAPRNRFYHRWLLARMQADWRGGPLDLTDRQRAALDEARSIRAFDDQVVAPANGFADADDYYARCSSGPLLRQIVRPTLLVHADDDPWIPVEIYRRYSVRQADGIRFVITRGGGHVGFHGRTGRWHDAAVRAFLG